MIRRVLVTNDDGIDSPGVQILARAVAEAGHEPILIAPQHQSSGSSAGIQFDSTAEKMCEEVNIPGLDHRAFAIAAQPALIVLLAVTGQFGPAPDAVITGVNDASNLGSAVLHSGTVGAAMVGASSGLPAAALSLCCDGQPEDVVREWDTTAKFVRTIIGPLLNAPAGQVVNINIPNVPVLEHGLRSASWSAARFAESLAPFIADFHRRAGTSLKVPEVEHPVGSDHDLIMRGYPTISTIRIAEGESGPLP